MRGEQVYLALSMSDGTVSIMGFGTLNLRPPLAGELATHFVEGPFGRLLAVASRREVNDDEVRAEIAKIVWESGAYVVSWRLLDGEPDLNDEYRDAWRDVRGSRDIEYDMPRARDLYRNGLRKARDQAFAKLDNVRRDAEDAEDRPRLRELAAVRQRLKDAPQDPRIEAAQTVAELRELGQSPLEAPRSPSETPSNGDLPTRGR